MFQVKDNSKGSIKYAGRSRAIVVDNIDPLKKGRVRVDHPLTGETEWIDYLHVPGIHSAPEIGDIVYVEADAGFATHPICWGNISKGYGNPEDLPVEFQRNKPTNRGFYTPEGHLIELDDGKDLLGTSKGIRITTSDGSKIHLNEEPTKQSLEIELSSGQTFKVDGLTDKLDIEMVGGLKATLDGTLDKATIATSGGATALIDGIADLTSLVTAGGAKAVIDGIADKITSEVSFGDKIEISAADGIQASTPAAGGTSISMKGGKIDVLSNLDITITSTTGKIEAAAVGGAKMKLNTGKVGLGGAGGELVDLLEQSLTQLDTLLTAMQAETHLGNLGFPSGPPINLASYVAVQVQINLIKGFVTAIKGGI